MLQLSNMNVFYGESHILRDVSLEVHSGQVLCLMGRNGVGKTTLLTSVMGLLRPRSGQVLLDGVDVTRFPPDQRVRRGLAYVPQGRDIFPHLTVRENLRLGLEAAVGSNNHASAQTAFEEVFGAPNSPLPRNIHPG